MRFVADVAMLAPEVADVRYLELEVAQGRVRRPQETRSFYRDLLFRDQHLFHAVIDECAVFRPAPRVRHAGFKKSE